MMRRQFIAAALAGIAGCTSIDTRDATPRLAPGDATDKSDATDAGSAPELLREEVVVTDTRFPFDLPADSRLVVEVEVDTGGPFGVLLTRYSRPGETVTGQTPTQRDYNPSVATSKRFDFEIGRAGTYYVHVLPPSAGDRATVRVWLEE